MTKANVRNGLVSFGLLGANDHSLNPLWVPITTPADGPRLTQSTKSARIRKDLDEDPISIDTGKEGIDGK